MNIFFTLAIASFALSMAAHSPLQNEVTGTATESVGHSAPVDHYWNATTWDSEASDFWDTENI